MGGQFKQAEKTTLTLQHFYAASPATVFQAWTRPEALRQWWCPRGWHPSAMEVDLREGGRYHLSMCGSTGRRIAVAGQFLKIEVPSRLIYTWLWDGLFDDAPFTTVKVHFRSVSGGTLLELAQGPLDLPDCSRHLHGWIDAFERLSEMLRNTSQWPHSHSEGERAASS